ncbi:hypothetical protein K438DRAFT_1752626 [Mycena galopus ATCC 62051]|nr:hypothetical protein K438DRAFT_1752626 [Mycena galopus ATCC 62051]
MAAVMPMAVSLRTALFDAESTPAKEGGKRDQEGRTPRAAPGAPFHSSVACGRGSGGRVPSFPQCFYFELVPPSNVLFCALPRQVTPSLSCSRVIPAGPHLSVGACAPIASVVLGELVILKIARNSTLQQTRHGWDASSASCLTRWSEARAGKVVQAADTIFEHVLTTNDRLTNVTEEYETPITAGHALASADRVRRLPTIHPETSHAPFISQLVSALPTGIPCDIACTVVAKNNAMHNFSKRFINNTRTLQYGVKY